MTTYKLLGTDLASRKVAAVEREAFLRDCWEEEIVVDLSSVEAISESYADEFFGVLVLRFGLTEILKKIKIANAKESVLKSIALAMQRRAESQTIAA